MLKRGLGELVSSDECDGETRPSALVLNLVPPCSVLGACPVLSTVLPERAVQYKDDQNKSQFLKEAQIN